MEDYCGTIYYDTIQILPSASVLLERADTVICKTQRISLAAAEGFNNYNWTPAYNIDLLTARNVIVYPAVTATYEVTAEKFPGCIMTDTIIVKVKECPQYFYVPAAFTPNNDGKNEVFKPSIMGVIQQYEFSIYNRWGQLVYKTNDTKTGWNGIVNNKRQDSGVYIWFCRYRFYNQSQETKKGTVLLIR